MPFFIQDLVLLCREYSHQMQSIIVLSLQPLELFSGAKVDMVGHLNGCLPLEHFLVQSTDGKNK